MFESIFGKIVLTALIASALATTGVATKDIVKSLYAAQIPKQGIDIQPMATLTPSPTIELSPTIAPTEKPLVEKITKTSGKCIITLFDIKYDVTEPNKKHVGGDIFNCGRDMTSIYKSKHGTDVLAMEMYLLNKPTPTLSPTTAQTIQINPTSAPTQPTTAPTKIMSTPTPTRSATYRYKDDNEERDDNEHSDRYVKDREDEREND